MRFIPHVIFATAALSLVGVGCDTQDPPKQVNAPVEQAPSQQPSKNEAKPKPAVDTLQYDGMGFSFKYPKNYTLTERNVIDDKAQYESQGLDYPVEMVILTKTSEIRPPGFVGEGPATINVSLWKNGKSLSLVEWAKKNNAYSNFDEPLNEGAEFTPSTFQGMQSIEYTSDGLYQMKTKLILLDDGVLNITVNYTNEKDDTNLAVYDQIVKSLKIVMEQY